jgi:hypothetical protein
MKRPLRLNCSSGTGALNQFITTYVLSSKHEQSRHYQSFEDVNYRCTEPSREIKLQEGSVGSVNAS